MPFVCKFCTREEVTNFLFGPQRLLAWDRFLATLEKRRLVIIVLSPLSFGIFLEPLDSNRNKRDVSHCTTSSIQFEQEQYFP